MPRIRICGFYTHSPVRLHGIMLNQLSTETNLLLLFHPRFQKLCEPTNSMNLSPSWETTSRSTTQEFPNILWNLKVHFHVHKGRHRTLSWARRIKSIPRHPISLSFVLSLSSHLHLGLLAVCVLPAFPPKFCAQSSSSCVLHALHISTSLTWSFWVIWRSTQVMKLLINQVSPASCYLIVVRLKYSSQRPILKHSQSVFFS
jgi:hypothetical protein